MATITVQPDSGVFRATLGELSAVAATPYEALRLLASRAEEAAYFEAEKPKPETAKPVAVEAPKPAPASLPTS